MDAKPKAVGGKSWLDALVGIQAGVLGGLVMLLWVILVSPLLGDPWWLLPNLLASTLYREPYRVGAGLITLVGGALHLIVCGLLGIVNGVFTPGGRLFGLAVAGSWYLFCYFILWKRTAPLLFHGSQSILIAGYFLFGSALGQHNNLMARARS